MEDALGVGGEVHLGDGVEQGLHSVWFRQWVALVSQCAAAVSRPVRQRLRVLVTISAGI
jgi:hypothetical protein